MKIKVVLLQNISFNLTSNENIHNKHKKLILYRTIKNTRKSKKSY